MKQQELDKLFRDALQPREEMPTDDVWARIARKLEEKDEAPVIPLVAAPKTVWGWRIYGAAASVLILAGSFYWFYGGKQEVENGISYKNTTEKQNAQKESVERLTYSTDKAEKAAETFTQNDPDPTDPKPKPQSTEPTQKKDTKPNTPSKTKDNAPQTPKNQTPKKQKTFRPAPARTELIAQQIAPRTPPQIDFILEEAPEQASEVTVTLILQPENDAFANQEKPTRGGFLRNIFAKKDKELKPKRKFKILGVDTEKALAFLRD